ncbi:MAG: hypothetical protein Q9217_002912 [Psora testacea]
MDDELFVRASELFVLVPTGTELDIKEVFAGLDQHHDESKAISLRSFPQRSLLYFDELLPLYIVLQTPYQEQDELSSYFDRISISLELRASGSAPRALSVNDTHQESSPARQEDIIWTGNLVAAEEPVMIIPHGKDTGYDRIVSAIWEVKALLSRPRIRLQSPMITFKGFAFLQAKPESIYEAIKDPYLPSGVPLPQNLFEPLRPDKRSGGPEPSLSASRLYRVQPLSEEKSLKYKPLTVHVPGAFSALPALSSRVRYHRLANADSTFTLVVSLDMEIAPFSQEDIKVTEVRMRLSGGSAVDLGRGLVPKLPLHCKPRDCIVFLYSLVLDDLLMGSAMSMSETLDIIINATVLVSDVCRPAIQMHWKTGVDCSSALKPNLFKAPGQSIQSSNRPPSLTVTSSSTPVNSIPPSSRDGCTKQDAAPALQIAVSVDESGLTITFTAPKTVYVLEPFTWDVLILNGSSKPRRLAISAVPKRSNGGGKGHPSMHATSSGGLPGSTNMAAAVMDEDELYAMQKTSIYRPSGVMSLSSTVEIG